MSDALAETVETLTDGDVIRLPRYENELVVTGRTTFEATGRLMVSLEFWKNQNDTEKSLMVSQDGGVSLHIGLTTVEPVDRVEKIASDLDDTDPCADCGDLITAGWFDRCDECAAEHVAESDDADDQESDDAPAHFDPDTETVSDAWEGVFLSCSWGYDQTQQNYAQIVDVSDSGKTVLCRRVGAEVVDRPNKTTEHVVPTAEHVGPEFRLHVRGHSSDDRPSFKGSYPFIWRELVDGDDDPSTRMGLFMPCDDDAKPDYQTAPNAGH